MSWTCKIFQMCIFFTLYFPIVSTFMKKKLISCTCTFSQNIFFTYINFPIAPTVCRRNLLSVVSNFFFNYKKYIFASSYADVRENHSLDFWTCSRILVFEFKCCIYSIGQEKSSAILCGPPILLDMEINYLYLHGWPHKYNSPRLWAYRIPGSRTLFFI